MGSAVRSLLWAQDHLPGAPSRPSATAIKGWTKWRCPPRGRGGLDRAVVLHVGTSPFPGESQLQGK